MYLGLVWGGAEVECGLQRVAVHESFTNSPLQFALSSVWDP
jgi:hypothetical protein